MLSFLDAILQGDAVYEDDVCNVKRRIFVDCVGMQSFTVHIYAGNARYRLFLNGWMLLLQLRRLGVNLEQGWSVYKCVSR